MAALSEGFLEFFDTNIFNISLVLSVIPLIMLHFALCLR